MLPDPGAERAGEKIRPAARRIGHDDAQRPFLLGARQRRPGERADEYRTAQHVLDLPYSFTRKKCAISPTMPRRNSSTAATKMTP